MVSETLDDVFELADAGGEQLQHGHGNGGAEQDDGEESGHQPAADVEAHD